MHKCEYRMVSWLLSPLFICQAVICARAIKQTVHPCFLVMKMPPEHVHHAHESPHSVSFYLTIHSTFQCTLVIPVDVSFLLHFAPCYFSFRRKAAKGLCVAAADFFVFFVLQPGFLWGCRGRGRPAGHQDCHPLERRLLWLHQRGQDQRYLTRFPIYLDFLEFAALGWMLMLMLRASSVRSGFSWAAQLRMCHDILIGLSESACPSHRKPCVEDGHSLSEKWPE